MDGERPATCYGCGRQADGPAVPLTWATGRERGHPVVHCDWCTRDHVRAIESKLDSEWW
jgi:hypothetical protein